MSRKYYLQCPYCDKRLEREDLVIHIDNKHSDEIPEGFTPLRITYHVANKRNLDNPRKCRVCGRPCPWDEKKGRYDQLCGRPECKKKQAERMGSDMGDKLRSNSPTQSTDGLEKMLAGRSISKKYTWRDGTVFVYTGSYEGKLLKWLDEVMEIKSEDLIVPGPTMYYEYDGEQHIYIPDFYYIPYNLIIEVKDGGDHPNTSAARRDSRLKTIAKEKHIINKTQYNYIRLTNNDFSQLLAVFADLKMNLIEDRQSRVIHINEAMTQAAISPMIGMGDIVLVDYIQNRAFCGKSSLAISNSENLTDLFGIDRRGKLDRIYKEHLVDSKYSAYIVTGVREKVENFLKENINREMDSDTIYEAIFGHRRTTADQILFEEGIYPCTLFEEVLNRK